MQRDVTLPPREFLAIIRNDFFEQADSADVVRAVILGLGRGALVVLVALAISCSGPQRDDRRAPEDTRVYHVQLSMTKEKPQANETLGRALEWWREHADTVDARPIVSGDDSAIRIVWKAPLYRVRLGPFPTARQAKGVLSAARSTFPDAFVAPARSSVNR